MNEEQERMLTAWNDPPASQAEEIAEARLWAAEQSARLIAAAPEMLEALKYLTAEIDHCVNNGWLREQPQYKAALDAIAKAEGREADREEPTP